PASERPEDYERINRSANQIALPLHADDTTTLALMAHLISERREPMFSRVRGIFSNLIATKYFKPGFDAVREEAFRNSGDYTGEFAEGTALLALSRVGSARDLRRMRSQLEASIAKGGYSHLRSDLFTAIGQLVARLYPIGSASRDEWLRWLEGFCAHPTPQQKETDCPSLAARALGIAGTAESKALLQSLIRADEPLNGSFAWAISDIEARLSRGP
ncbi:MAG TPA: hypothetical protein VF551_09390, partial [Chthoniobacterales bacterium]